MKLEVLQEYNDKEQRRLMKVGEIFEVDVKRGNLLVSRGYAKVVTDSGYSEPAMRSRSRRESYGMETENT